MRTGDKYYTDEQRHYYFAGRGDDRFKIGGQWVLPLEVEDVLLQHESVLDAAIVSETGSDELPHVVAFIALKPGRTATASLEQELKRHARRNLAHFKSPQRIVFVGEILRTATGKIDRKGLRAQGSVPAREEAPPRRRTAHSGPSSPNQRTPQACRTAGYQNRPICSGRYF
jgi:acyl-coenzyme A synthetase/AMP-(fatty) acid ligase